MTDKRRISNRDLAVFAVSSILLVLYILPVFLAALIAPFGALTSSSWIGETFLTLLASPTGITALLHKLLVPIVAGVSTVSLWHERFAWRPVMLLTIAVIGFISTVCLIVFLERDPAKDLWQLELSRVKFANAEHFFLLKDQYLSGMLEALGTYIVLLLGLQAIPAK